MADFPAIKTNAKGKNLAWRLLWASFLLALAVVLGWILRPPPPASSWAANGTVQLRLAGTVLKLEVAADEEARCRGLSGRTSLPANGGMLFVYPSPRPLNFWMAGCLMDLDILFLDARGTVVSSWTMRREPLRQPEESEESYWGRLERYPSIEPAVYAVEVAPGTVRRLGLRRGDRAEFLPDP